MPDGTDYPPEVVADAIVTYKELGSVRKAERALALKYPDRHPDRSTISLWARQDDEAFAILSREQRRDLAARAFAVVDKLTERADEAVVHLQPGQVYVPWGISIDKYLRLTTEDAKTPNVNVGVFVVVKGEQPAVIEDVIETAALTREDGA